MYCTVEEVLGMIKDDMKNVIIGDEYIEDADEREAKIAALCEDAISDACAEIDGYLAKRYRVPFGKTPQVINKFAKDISVYNLVSRTGIDESEREKTILNRYNAAINFLLACLRSGRASTTYTFRWCAATPGIRGWMAGFRSLTTQAL